MISKSQTTKTVSQKGSYLSRRLQTSSYGQFIKWLAFEASRQKATNLYWRSGSLQPTIRVLAFITSFDDGLNLNLPATKRARRRPLSVRCSYPSFDPRKGYMWCTASSSRSRFRCCPAHYDQGTIPPTPQRLVLILVSQDCMTNRQDYVELGISCGDVCQALDRGLNGRRLDELSQSVLGAIGKLTA